MADPFVGEIRIFGFNFAPRGWAFCDGQLLPISQNTALFSLLGTFYGGDGKSTFALPDMQGNAPVGAGDGPGLSPRFLGETAGSSSVTLLVSEIPLHNHLFNVLSDPGDLKDPSAHFLARSQNGSAYTTPGPLVNMNFQYISITGSSFPHNNMQPYLTANFCIAMQGVFPPRG